MKEDVVIVIPAYNPDDKLEKVIKDLKINNYKNIIVVNDGSEKVEIFKKIKDEIILINHKKNLGQGCAVKTGIKFVIENYKNIKSVVTMDADGQHKVEDVNNLYNQIQKQNDTIILGSRNFEQKNVPFRSKFGNKVISFIFEKKINKKVMDTQTGLRIIPQMYLKDIDKMTGERFEFAICFLIYCIKNNIPFIEMPIETIYIDKNNSSHYKAIRDSIKIYSIMNKELKKYKCKK